MKKAAPANPIPPPGVSAATPLPTPPTASAGLLVGVYALVKLTLTGSAVLHLFDCEVRVTQRMVEVTGHGDEWDQWVPLRQGWTARARGYMTRSGAAATTYPAGAANKTASGPEMTFTLYSDWGTTKIFEGLCFYEDITISRPQAMVEQEITLRGSVAPTTGPA